MRPITVTSATTSTEADPAPEIGQVRQRGTSAVDQHEDPPQDPERQATWRDHEQAAQKYLSQERRARFMRRGSPLAPTKQGAARRPWVRGSLTSLVAQPLQGLYCTRPTISGPGVSCLVAVRPSTSAGSPP